MTRHVRLREFLVAIEGLALGRTLLEGDDAVAAARIDEVRRIVGDEETSTFAAGIDVPELDVRDGYGAWSCNYDEPGNPLIAVEEPVVRSILADVPPGRVLDAACGTARHARYLAARGHEVTGADLSAGMLARARVNAPRVPVVESDLRSLPFADGRFDLVVCSLALMHVSELATAIAELARATRAGGRVVLSDLHPSGLVGGGQAFFVTADGAAAFVRQFLHRHGDYLAAFATAGLAVRQCLEPAFGPESVAMQRLANTFIPEASAAALLGLPGALVWDLARV